MKPGEGFIPCYRYTRETGEKVVVYRAGRLVAVEIDDEEVRRDIVPLRMGDPRHWAMDYEAADRKQYRKLLSDDRGAK